MASQGPHTACQALKSSTLISAHEMVLDEINGDGECRVSTVMAKMLEMQEIMSYLPVTQQVDTRH